MSKRFNAYTIGEQAINGLDLTNKYCIVTGSNSGIGKETAKILYKHGCNVIMACRNIDKANKARDDIKNNVTSSRSANNNDIIVMQLDLSSLKSVRNFAANYVEKYKQLNYLINNAGIMALSSYTKSKDGYELTFAVNHIGHFYLSQLLLPMLIKNKTRVIVVSSVVVNWTSFKQFDAFLNKLIQNKCGPLSDDYQKWNAYGLAKAANILFAREFNRRYEKDGVIAVSLHPGLIKSTSMAQNAKIGLSDVMQISRTVITKYGPLQFIMDNRKNLSQGIATTLRCVSLSDDEINGGDYYFNCQSGTKYDKLKGAAKPIKYDDYEKDSLEMKLWRLTEILIRQKGFEMTL